MSLNKSGITTAIVNFFKSDITTLFGTGKLVQIISGGIKYYTKAKVNVKKPYGLFLLCNEDTAPIQVLCGNTYQQNYIIDFKIHAIHNNDISQIESQVDLIWEHIKKMWNEESTTGNWLHDYYTDSSKQIINMLWDNTSTDEDIINDDGIMSMELNGKLIITINTIS